MRTTWLRAAASGSIAMMVACGGDAGPATDRAAADAPIPATGAMATGVMAASAPVVLPGTSINAVMVGLVDHASHHIWDLGRDGMAPESEADWQEVEHHAIQLIAGGTYITIGGTGVLDANWVQQPEWQGYAQDVSDAGVAAYDAALRRDLSGVLSAGDSLILACEGCHADYKPALPTEGITHPHYD